MRFISSLFVSRSIQEFRRLGTAFVGCGVMALTIAAPRVASAQSLTGISLFSTNATGAASGNDIWNTWGGDSYYNLWVSLAGTAINGPLDANAGINQILMTPGTYEFTIFGNPGNNFNNHGINLFFDGDNTNPSISAYAPTASAATDNPSFFADNENTLDLGGSGRPGSGSLSYSTGGNTVTLTNYRWEYSTVQNRDVVGIFDRAAKVRPIIRVALRSRSHHRLPPPNRPRSRWFLLGEYPRLASRSDAAKCSAQTNKTKNSANRQMPCRLVLAGRVIFLKFI